MIIFLLFFLALIDYLFGYFVSFLPAFFTYLQSQFFITTILSFFLLKSQNKKMIMFLFVGILIYDLLFSRIYFFRTITLFLLYRMILYLKRFFHLRFFSYFVFMIISFWFYFLFQYLILFGIGITQRSIFYLVCVFSHFIIFHVIYSTILYYILGIKKRKT